MPKTGQKTITVSGDNLTKLEAEYSQKKIKQPSLTFSGFVAESAVINLETQNLLREAARISLIGENNGIITLKDFKNENRFVEVKIAEDGPICLEHNNSTECVHVGFVLALPEVRRHFIQRTV